MEIVRTQGKRPINPFASTDVKEQIATAQDLLKKFSIKDSNQADVLKVEIKNATGSEATAADYKVFKEFTDQFGSLGRIVRSLAQLSSSLTELSEKQDKPLQKDQKKAVGEEQVLEENEAKRVIRSKEFDDIVTLVKKVKERLRQGETGEQIAANLGDSAGLLGPGFIKLLKNNPKKVVNLLSKGLDNLSELSKTEGLSKKDFAKTLQAAVAQVLGALKGGGEDDAPEQQEEEKPKEDSITTTDITDRVNARNVQFLHTARLSLIA